VRLLAGSDTPWLAAHPSGCCAGRAIPNLARCQWPVQTHQPRNTSALAGHCSGAWLGPFSGLSNIWAAVHKPIEEATTSQDGIFLWGRSYAAGYVHATTSFTGCVGNQQLPAPLRWRLPGHDRLPRHSRRLDGQPLGARPNRSYGISAMVGLNSTQSQIVEPFWCRMHRPICPDHPSAAREGRDGRSLLAPMSSPSARPIRPLTLRHGCGDSGWSRLAVSSLYRTAMFSRLTDEDAGLDDNDLSSTVWSGGRVTSAFSAEPW
jgi:hypothetical protein